MGGGSDRLRRTTTAFAMPGLLGLPAACGAADEPSSGGTSAAAATKAPSTPKGGAGVSRQGMTDGCDTVHQLFVALDAGDKATAESLKDRGKKTFDEVVTAAAEKDEQLASNATAMADMLGFGLPEEPIHQSELAEVYAVDCVAQYGTAALPG